MSKAALQELSRLPIDKFMRMVKSVPQSEKKEVTQYLIDRANILGDI